MTGNKPADGTEHPRLVLAGDFSSPAEVLAANALGDDQKREILNVWRNDLVRTGGSAEHEKLLADIDEALTRLAEAPDLSASRS